MSLQGKVIFIIFLDPDRSILKTQSEKILNSHVTKLETSLGSNAHLFPRNNFVLWDISHPLGEMPFIMCTAFRRFRGDPRDDL